nr:hypothetical protein BaRGS_029452 [Batillaria attramentaria]
MHTDNVSKKPKDLSNTIFATPPHHPGYQSLNHATTSPHRSLDTGQSGHGYHLHYSGTHGDGSLGNGGEIPLGTAPQQLGGYPLNTTALRAATRHHATTSPYGHLPDLSLSSASDCYLNGNTANANINVAHNGQGMCMDISPGVRAPYPGCPPDGVRGAPTPTSGYLPTAATSPIKSEMCGNGGLEDEAVKACYR